MSNVLNEQTKQQIIALGRLGWSLRRIQKTTGVRRETASAYLKEAGVGVSAPGWSRSEMSAGDDSGPPSAKPAIAMTTDFGAGLAPPTNSGDSCPDVAASADAVQANAKPAMAVITDFGVAPALEARKRQANTSRRMTLREALVRSASQAKASVFG